MRITESRLRSLIKRILKENDLQIINTPSQSQTSGFVSPRRRNVNNEELEKNFLEIIKTPTNLYDIISYYTEKKEETPTVIINAFLKIILGMYKKKFKEELKLDDKRFIYRELTELMSSYDDE